MIINKLSPQGYCNGVMKALIILEESIKDETLPKPIYMLGGIIHNKNVIDHFRNLGVIIIDDKNKSRLELLDQIDKGSVCVSAHGVSPLVYKKIKEKGLTLIDASCKYVLMIHNKIKYHLDNNYSCIYIGTLKHPECEGVLGISDKIHLVTSLDDIDNLNINNDKIYVTNQTTLSKIDLQNFFTKLKEKYPNIIIDDKICNATTVRQQAVINQPDADLLIVIGDKSSSNTKKLYTISQKYTNIKTIMCESLNDLDKEIIKDCKIINITSGASTPSFIVDEIINYLKQL